ncbi:MAG: iron ABC transporter permease, partial [Kiritimatiellae bacterium]|nr:iron ABC transporter permease [Kiritimatiellia bacterium]
MTRPGRYNWVVLGVLVLLAMATVFGAPFVGGERITPRDVFSGRTENLGARIFWDIRFPRVLLAFVAGTALATSGMAFQALFRNPLATPYTLGVASGASLGAALYLHLGGRLALPGFTGLPVAAFLGAAFSVVLVYGLTRARKSFSTAAMLLAGVAVSFFFSSLILFVQYLSDFTQAFRIVRWLMGGLEVVGYRSLWGLLPFVAVGTLTLACLTNELNLILTGDELAMSRGVNVPRLKKLVFFATSLMVGGVVAFCGPIGFVGMMAPHICRLVVGANHRSLMPATFLFGGIFLTLCDTVARTVIAPAEIPVGVITSLLGGPFFLWLLLLSLIHI